MNNEIMYTDAVNGLHILSDGIVVEVDGYPNEIKQYGRLVAVDIDYKDGKLEYSYTTTRDIRRPEVYGMGYPYGSDTGLLFTIGRFKKEYETMGLEVSLPIEETKQNDYPETKEDLDKLLEPIKLKSYGRGKPTIYGDGCTMMDKIKNIDVESLYPKTTISSNLSIHDDKIIEAYNQFLTMIFDKEKYDGISIRVPKECTEDWFEILPCFKYVRKMEYKITPELDLYVNIKKLGIGRNCSYIVDVSGIDYITSNINNSRSMFSDYGKILNLNVSDLQTRLLDIIQDTKVDESNDTVYSAGQLANNLLRGLPFNHIDDFDLEGDSITYEINSKNKLSGLKELNPTDLSDRMHLKDDDMDSLLKRLPENNPLDNLTVDDIVDNTELNMLKDVYDKHMGIVSIRCENDRNRLDDNYRSVFKKHIAKGVLYPKLRFNSDYGYTLNENGSIEYGITKTQIVPFKSMISNKPMNIHKDIMERYSVLITTQANMSSIPVGSNVIDSNQVDSCIDIYRTMFSRYIELGVLKNTLIYDVVKNTYTFPSIWEIYNDSYIYQNKPTRLYNIYLNVVLAFSDNMNLRYAKTTINGIYKSIFKRYIEMGLMKSEIEYTSGLPFPTIDKLWLCK